MHELSSSASQNTPQPLWNQAADTSRQVVPYEVPPPAPRQEVVLPSDTDDSLTHAPTNRGRRELAPATEEVSSAQPVRSSAPAEAAGALATSDATAAHSPWKEWSTADSSASAKAEVQPVKAGSGKPDPKPSGTTPQPAATGNLPARRSDESEELPNDPQGVAQRIQPRPSGQPGEEAADQPTPETPHDTAHDTAAEPTEPLAEAADAESPNAVELASRPGETEEVPTVTLPAGVLGQLMQRVRHLEATNSTLREELARRPAAVDDTNAPVPADAANAVQPPPQRLYSALEAAAQTPFTEIQAQAADRGALLEGFYQHTAECVGHFAGEMFSRVPIADGYSTNLPPAPSYTESPEKYKRYVDKHSNEVKWEEVNESGARYKVKLTYLPTPTGPELVRADVNVEESIPSQSPHMASDLHVSSVTFGFTPQGLTSLSMNDTVSEGLYKPRFGKPYHVGVRHAHEVKVTVAPDLSVTDNRFAGYPITYRYDQKDRQFVDVRGNNVNPHNIPPPISGSEFLDRVDTIQGHVPRMNA